MKIINLGCGNKINEAFINLDISPTMPGVIKCDFLSGIPYSDGYFDVVYHSHVLEHFTCDDGKKFIAECYRVLKPDGIIRIAVPDLENIVRQYLKYLESAVKGEPLAEDNYNWLMLELYDQAVRSEGGGNMGKYLTQKQIHNENFIRERIGFFYDLIRQGVNNNSAAKKSGLKQKIKNILPENYFLALKNTKNKLLNIFNIKALQYYRLGKFRQSGEVHQWMYDRFSLSRLLSSVGFTEVKTRGAVDSYIDNWSEYQMDADKEGQVYKKDSLFMEGIKRANNISFVMPAFNSAGTIAESVDSIFNENFENGDELIIVNDGSTDDTDKIIEELKNKYPQITYITNPSNIGCPASRNIGIKAAANPLIFNLDSDNILAPNSVKKLKEYLLAKRADVATFGECRYFSTSPKKITHKWLFIPGIMTLADFLAGPFNPGPGGNYLYTKASWEKIGGYWEYGYGLHEAWGFTLKQLANGAKLVIVPGTFYFHRYGWDSLTIREAKKKDEGSLMASKMIAPFLNLLSTEDATLIKSETGARTWFENFSQRPLKLKNSETGKTGTVLINLNLLGKLDQRFPALFKFLKKLLQHEK